MKSITIIILYLIPTITICQESFDDLEMKNNFKSVISFSGIPVMEDIIWPKYINGKTGLDNLVIESIKYPDIALENNIEANVVLTYSINSKAEVVDVVATSDSPEILNKELIKIILKSGPWIPGKKNGKYIKMKLSISYEFKIDKP